MIDTRTRSIFPDIESFQRSSSLQGRGIGEVQNSVLVQENVDHLHILGISHTIHLGEKKEWIHVSYVQPSAYAIIFANLMNPLLSILDFLRSDIASLGTHFNEYLTREVGGTIVG
jgi:hypothetical protein